MKHVLVIDDEPGHRLMLRAVLEDAGWQVSEAASGEAGVALLRQRPEEYSVALVDMKMPGMDGHATLNALHDIRSDLPVILLTAYGTVGAAVEAMKQGAFDYLSKPADNDELILTLTRAYEFCCLYEENDRLKSALAKEEATKKIIGVSPAIRTVRNVIEQAGASEATVLISGESGTGKELIAEALHKASARSHNPLVRVNCAALPAQLLESELFGYEKGAFTGAMKSKPGRFQLADKGTLLLDEIGEMPLDVQAKLLRILQDKLVDPLGGVKPVAVDVRILAATNKNLRHAVAAGTFREDLYFRLHVIEIIAPPLRQRLDDLPQLTHHLLGLLAEKNKKNIRGVSPAFLQALTHYSWPGNVRELENILERALILSRTDLLDVDSLPAYVLHPHQPAPGSFSVTTGTASGGSFAGTPLHAPAHSDATPAPEPMAAPAQPLAGMGGSHVPAHSPAYANQPPASQRTTSPLHASSLPLPPHASLHEAADQTAPRAASLLEQAEYEALLHALEQHQGHREKTAETLGISRRTLQYKLKKYGLIRRW